MNFGSLFAGIGGMDLGLERAGMVCKWQVEIDDYATRVLAKHWPTVPKYRDVREVGKDNLESVDLICGGFPCQDISNAGKRAGIDGERSGLWSEFFRIICELRPRYVLVENVAALLNRGMSRVLGDLASCGYDAEWHSLRAEWFGVPQSRPRVFIIAYPSQSSSWTVLHQDAFNAFRNRAGLHGARRATPNSNHEDYRTGSLSILGDDEWPAIPYRERSRTDGGIPHRLDRLHGLGNAVVPQVAEWIGNQIMATQ